MSKTITIALDAMGGDNGPSVCVPAAQEMCKRYPNLQLILVGRKENIEPLLNGASSSDRIRIVDAREVVAMDEPPADALRKKKNSSLRVSIDLVKSGEAEHRCADGDGAVCAENPSGYRSPRNYDRSAYHNGPLAYAGPRC